MTLTAKEKSLLKDLKSQEEICVAKYQKYANEAHDGQLKNLFSQIGQAEQQHLQAICDIENGKVPQMQSSSKQMPSFVAGDVSPQDKKEDAYLCADVLSTEKHVSAVYDTCIFEFTTENLRDVLNTIQKQEQAHGEMIYNYMSANNMYC